MIYLRTGSNGAGKTLLTLKEVREKSLKENRPVYHNGRFEVVAGGPLDGWKSMDARDWQTVPDGAIFIIDECHNDFPVRADKTVPDYVKMLAEHRRRGFDFYMITQHPMNIDPFVRRLIGSPGWHQHLKRVSGAPLVSVLEWPAVNEQPQKNGSGASAAVKMVPFPKEVYAWYASTSLDTAKVKIPFQVKMLAAAALLIPLLGYYGWQSFKHNQEKRFAPAPGAAAPAVGVHPGSGGGGGDKVVQTPAEYLASYQPRIVGLPHTAPRYDDATKPTIAPFPAACVNMGARCDCFTQQGTKLQTPADLCKQIVAGGFFQDWGQGIGGGSGGAGGAPAASAAPVAPTGGNPGIAPSVALASADPVPRDPSRDSDALASMRIGKRLVPSY